MLTSDGLKALDSRQLLRLYAAVMREMRTRSVIRSSNNPVADLAERLCARAFGLTLQGKSTTGYDGTSGDGSRYEVKARRITPENRSTQLSAIRDLGANHFDYLVAVLFDEDFGIRGAYRMPAAAVARHAKFRKHVNAHIMLVRDVIGKPGVEDVTPQLSAAMKAVLDEDTSV